MDLKNISEVKNMEKVMADLINEYNSEDLTVKYWETEEERDAGISSLYIPMETTLEGIIYEAKRLIDRECYASTEVIFNDEDGEETVLYFYDAVDEMILAYA